MALPSLLHPGRRLPDRARLLDEPSLIQGTIMNGLMMQQPLLISTLLAHAERHHGEQEIVSRRVEGDLHRQTYRQLGERARRMANALAARGMRFGDRVATLAWNGYRHM